MFHVCFIMTVTERTRGKAHGMKGKRERLVERSFCKQCCLERGTQAVPWDVRWRADMWKDDNGCSI